MVVVRTRTSLPSDGGSPAANLTYARVTLLISNALLNYQFISVHADNLTQLNMQVTSL